MTDRKLSRRSVLKTSAGAIAAGAMSGLAGCSGIPGLGGGGGSQGSNEIQTWAFDPGEIGEREYRSARYVNYGSHRDNEDAFDEDYYDNIEANYENAVEARLDIDFDEANWQVSLGQFSVLNANHTVEDVVEFLEDEADFEEEDDDVSGYTTILGPNETTAYAADGSNVLSARAQDALDAIEDFIDTQNGEIDMWVDEEEDFADAITNVSGDVVTASLVDSDNTDVVASGISASFNGETTTVQSASVYDEEDDYDREEFQEQANEEDEISVSFNGRVVVAEIEQDTDEYGGGGFGPTP